MTNPHAQLFSGKHVIVMGLGRFGGGAGAANYVASLGAHVTISDRATEDQLETGLAKIKPHLDSGAIQLSLGTHDESLLDTADILIVNPAVPRPWDNPFIARAKQRGVRLETEIGLTTDRIGEALNESGRVIAVTGSVGKSTTAAMTHHTLFRPNSRPALLGGNIGGSLLDTTINPDAVVILELSSAMLHWLRETRPDWSPHVAVLTGYEPNHLDWHAEESHYRASKQHLLDTLANNPGRAHAILGPSVTDWPIPPNATRHIPTPFAGLQTVLPGAHNRINAALAAWAIYAALRIDLHSAAETAAAFRGLPHRLAVVQSLAAMRRQVTCYNDSKSTTPGTTAAAVAALRERHDHIWLIAGGADKGIDLSPLAQLSDTTLLTIGTTGPAIAAAAASANTSHHQCHTLDAAVAHAARHAQPNHAILLSPACASWDQFPNYEARGDAFIAALATHLGAPDADRTA